MLAPSAVLLCSLEPPSQSVTSHSDVSESLCREVVDGGLKWHSPGVPMRSSLASKYRLLENHYKLWYQWTLRSKNQSSCLPRLAMFLVRHQIMPLGFVSQRIHGQAENNFTEKVVGAVTLVIPNGDFERTLSELGPLDAPVNESLVPSRVICVYYSLGSFFGLFARNNKDFYEIFLNEKVVELIIKSLICERKNSDF